MSIPSSLITSIIECAYSSANEDAPKNPGTAPTPPIGAVAAAPAAAPAKPDSIPVNIDMRDSGIARTTSPAKSRTGFSSPVFFTPSRCMILLR